MKFIKIEIKKIILIGILISIFFILLGGILFIVQNHNNVMLNYETFHGEPKTLTFIPHMIVNAVRLDPKSLIQFGLYLLILFQLLKVIKAAITFIKVRDKYFISMSLFIMIVMLGTLTKSI